MCVWTYTKLPVHLLLQLMICDRFTEASEDVQQVGTEARRSQDV